MLARIFNTKFRSPTGISFEKCFHEFMRDVAYENELICLLPLKKCTGFQLKTGSIAYWTIEKSRRRGVGNMKQGRMYSQCLGVMDKLRDTIWSKTGPIISLNRTTSSLIPGSENMRQP